MINQRMLELGKKPSAIRQLYAYGLQRKALVGEDKVYDFSIGNPSIPAPEGIRDSILSLMEESPVKVHGYTMAGGLLSTREAVARNLRDRFGIEATSDQVYMTTGATGALDIAIQAVVNPGDDVIVNAPYFPEYKVMIETARANCVEVNMTVPEFLLDIDALEQSINARTKAIMINSPNNPVGCIYPEENIKALADLLRRKEKEYSHPIYLISDEPYRELTYGKEVPFTANYYDNTFVCYSWAKSLSLPGERIGYLYVSDRMENKEEVYFAVCGAGRALGFVCAPALFQQVIEKCIDLPTDVEAYRENRAALTKILSDNGYTYVEPDGAFYLWVKALEDDAQAFSDRARDFDLLIVPSDSFGSTGWVRCSYCVSRDTISNSAHAWKELMQAYS